MAAYELYFTMSGRIVVEADDEDEAESLVHDNLVNLDSSMFDEFDVEEVATDSVESLEEDADA